MLKTRCIVDFNRPGWFHMAADDYLARFIIDTEYDAVLRFYTWQPPAVSLGCHQKTDVIDIQACNERDWDVVFRSTGGRLLLHRNDLSYSIVLKSANDRFSRLRELYSNIATAITTVLKKMNIEADTATKSHKRGVKLRSGLCLDARVRGEVSVDGKKIAAAAQHIYRESLLQHGSIQLAGDTADIVEITNLTTVDKEDVKHNLRNEACALDSLMNGKADIEVLVEMLKLSVINTMKLQIIEDVWNDDEIEYIDGTRARFEIASINKGIN